MRKAVLRVMPRYERAEQSVLKTCSAILQTLQLMKGSSCLCSLHTYKKCNAAIISVHFDACLIRLFSST